MKVKFGFLIPAVVVFSVLCLNLSGAITPDTYFSLTQAREVLDHGFSTTNQLTIYGEQSFYTQWLAQIILYAAYQINLLVVALLSPLLTALAVGLVAWSGQRKGYSLGSITAATLMATPVLFVFAQSRSQAFALVLFVLLLLSLESKKIKTNALAIPIIVVWANVHGSVVLGLVAVFLWISVEVLKSKTFPAVKSVIALVSGAALFANPYGIGVVDYFKQIQSSNLGDYVSEWKPLELSSSLVLFVLLLMFAVVFMLGKHHQKVSWFMKSLLALLIVESFLQTRISVFFALVAIMILVKTLELEWAWIKSKSVVLAVAAIGLTCLGIGIVGFDPRFQIQSIQSIQGPVFADETTADFLLLKRPDLKNQVAYNARLESLSASQRAKIISITQGNTKQLQDFKWLVFSNKPKLLEAIAKDENWKIVENQEVVVATRK